MQPPEPALLTAGSVVLAALNLTVMWLLSRSSPTGWLVGLAMQPPGVVYDIWSRQYGFVAVSAVMVPVYVKGWRNFRRNRELLETAATGAADAA